MIGVENRKQQMEDTGHGVRVSLSTDGNTSGRMEGLMMLGTGSGVGWGGGLLFSSCTAKAIVLPQSCPSIAMSLCRPVSPQAGVAL